MIPESIVISIVLMIFRALVLNLRDLVKVWSANLVCCTKTFYKDACLGRDFHELEVAEVFQECHG